jgi:hypothetical protein
MPAGIFVTTKDVMRIRGLGEAGAYMALRLIKDSLGKARKQRVTIDEYCQYEGITLEAFAAAVKA